MNTSLTEFCSYIQPILTSCLGFVKTDGYMSHIPGAILAMSADETVFAVIKIPVIFDVYMTAQINKFMQLKTPEEQEDMFNRIYFTGWNIKNTSLLQYFNTYESVEQRCTIFEEPDCFNIPGFNEAVSSTLIGNVKVSNGLRMFIIPASKSITNLNKSDTVNLKIYDCAFDPSRLDVKTVKYTMFKKKFKLNIDIFANILAF